MTVKRHFLPAEARSSPKDPCSTITTPWKSAGKPPVKQKRPALSLYKGMYSGKRALIIGGGLSALNWEDLRRRLLPDVIVGVNGVVGAIPDELDFWLCIENLAWMMPWFSTETRAVKCIGANIYQRREDWETIVPVQRNIIRAQSAKTTFGLRLIPDDAHLEFTGYVDDIQYLNFRNPSTIRLPIHPHITDRQFGLFGGVIKTDIGHPTSVLQNRDVGTVMVQALHLCGILGCEEIHTVGLDLCFKGPTHWYADRDYDSTADIAALTGVANWHRNMYTHQYGVDTTWWWIECAALFEILQPILELQRMYWTDHSDGLLQRRGKLWR